MEACLYPPPPPPESRALLSLTQDKTARGVGYRWLILRIAKRSHASPFKARVAKVLFPRTPQDASSSPPARAEHGPTTAGGRLATHVFAQHHLHVQGGSLVPHDGHHHLQGRRIGKRHRRAGEFLRTFGERCASLRTDLHPIGTRRHASSYEPFRALGECFTSFVPWARRSAT